MEKYVKIYSFQVMDKVCEGKEVYCIDRGLKTIDKVSLLPVRALAIILNESDMPKFFERYEFFYVAEEADKSLDKAIEEVKRFAEEGAKNDNI